MKTKGYITTGLAAISAMPTLQTQAKTDLRPNIIMILVDDLGYSDLGCYGATDIDTPNLDRLAQEGTRFRQFYNASFSAPTRASVITGQYHHKAGVGYFENHNLGLPSYQGYLNRESITFAEVLRQAGYSTLHSGKWNVGVETDQLPLQRGFDHTFGFKGGATAFYNIDGRSYRNAPLKFLKEDQPYTLESDKYLTDAITDFAIESIENQNREFKGQKPFFLYLAYNAPHYPLQAPAEDIEKYRGRVADGFDAIRQERYENVKRLGLLPANNAIAHRDDSLNYWRQLTYDQQQYWQREREVFCAMVDRVDQSVGRILEVLRRLGKDQNTLIIFCSDNGPQGTIPYQGAGPQIYSARPEGPTGAPNSAGLTNSYWSQVGASPFRNYKRTLYEGGISSPFIAWFPGHVKAGQIVDGIGHIIDLAPTFYDVAGAKYPAHFNGVNTYPLPGKSLLPVLVGKADHVDRSEPLFWEREGHHAIRQGKWKYIRDFQAGEDELYDIEADRGENINLVDKYPEVADRLKTLWEDWADHNGVVKDYRRLLHGQLKNQYHYRVNDTLF